LILANQMISGGPFRGPLVPLKPGVSKGHPVFQGGQAPSGPLVIRPLVMCETTV